MRILLVEDHKPTRDEMRRIIDREEGMTVVAEAENGEDAIDRARERHPDVVVMDILLPGMNGIDVTRRIRAEDPNVVVLALSNHFGDSLVRAVFDAGGVGYVRKHRAFEDLIPALRCVAAGRTYVSGHGADWRPPAT